MEITLRKHITYNDTGLCEWQPEHYKKIKRLKGNWYKLKVENISPDNLREKVIEIFTKMRPGDKLKLGAEYDREQKVLTITDEKISVSKVVKDRTTLGSLIYELKQKETDRLTQEIIVSYPVKGKYRITIEKVE